MAIVFMYYIVIGARKGNQLTNVRNNIGKEVHNARLQ